MFHYVFSNIGYQGGYCTPPESTSVSVPSRNSFSSSDFTVTWGKHAQTGYI